MIPNILSIVSPAQSSFFSKNFFQYVNFVKATKTGVVKEPTYEATVSEAPACKVLNIFSLRVLLRVLTNQVTARNSSACT